MADLYKWYDNLLTEIKRRQAEARVLAAEMGMTIEEYDADVTAPDGGKDD